MRTAVDRGGALAGATLSIIALFAALLGAGASTPARAQAVRIIAAERAENARAALRSGPRGGVLGLMGYNVTPDGSANALQINRSSSGEEDSSTLLLSQLGFGFTVSESFPLFLEVYVGTARYDPRPLFGGEGARRLPLRWNNIAGTVGIGYDIALTENLWLRPIVNFSAGYAASDAALFGAFVNFRRETDLSRLTNVHMNVRGQGGSLVLAYYDYRPQRDIEAELRYTHIYLETFGDTPPEAAGSSTARTLGLWSRYRWPTGREAFGRPVRWVLDGSFTTYLGDQRDAIGFTWSAKLGGGIELDVGRREIGAVGLSLSRFRLIGRYFVGDKDVSGYSFGLGVSF